MSITVTVRDHGQCAGWDNAYFNISIRRDGKDDVSVSDASSWKIIEETDEWIRIGPDEFWDDMLIIKSVVRAIADAEFPRPKRGGLCEIYPNAFCDNRASREKASLAVYGEEEAFFVKRAGFAQIGFRGPALAVPKAVLERIENAKMVAATALATDFRASG